MDNSKKKGLGLGISALLGESLNINRNNNDTEIGHAEIGNVQEIDIDFIIPNKEQPRKYFDESKISELAQSISANGLLQPIIVIKKEDRYLIVAGERRYRACKFLGLKKVKALTLSMSESEVLKNAIIENVQREDLNPIEEANGYKKIIDHFNYTHETLANEVGKSRSHITNLLRLLNLPEEVQLAISKKEITLGHAKVLLTANDPINLMQKIIDQELSVRKLEELIKNGNQEINKNNNQENNEDVSEMNPEDLTYEMIKQIYNPILKNYTEENNDTIQETKIQNKVKDSESDLNEDEIQVIKKTNHTNLSNEEIDEIDSNINMIEKHIRENTNLDISLNINKNNGSGNIVINYETSEELLNIIKRFFIEF